MHATGRINNNSAKKQLCLLSISFQSKVRYCSKLGLFKSLPNNYSFIGYFELEGAIGGSIQGGALCDNG